MSWVHELVAPASHVRAIGSDLFVGWERQRQMRIGIRRRVGLAALRLLQHLSYGAGWVAGMTIRRRPHRAYVMSENA
jgi:hypothetical protein